MTSDIKLEYNLELGFHLEYGEFDVQGFYKGYSLFQAILQAEYLQTNTNGCFTPQLNQQILNTCRNSLETLHDKLPPNLSLELEQVLERYEYIQSHRKRSIDWESGIPGTSFIELFERDGNYDLFYSVFGDDYNVGYTSGFDCYDAEPTFLHHQFPSLIDAPIKKLDWNSLIDTAVCDADGKFVFLVQRGIKSFKDIFLLDYLRNDVDNQVMTENQYNQIAKTLFGELG